MTERRDRVLVIMGGVSHEREISLESGRTAVAHFPRDRFDVDALVIRVDGLAELSRNLDPSVTDETWPPPATESHDVVEALLQCKRGGTTVVFIALHGPGGEDGALQGCLEWLGMSYAGADVAASSIAMNKVFFKALMEKDGIPTAPAVFVRPFAWRTDRLGVIENAVAATGLPAFVKAATEGSSFGLYKVDTENALAEALDAVMRSSSMALVEALVPGVELSCGVMGRAAGDLRAFPVVEIVPRAADYFDYESKYAPGGADEIIPARIAGDAATRMTEIAMDVHRLIGTDGVTRTDAILRDDGEIVVLETNTIPGLAPASILPKAAEASGMSIGELLTEWAELTRS